MKTHKAILLAGGFGTRLKEVLPDIPKCMAPINGRPFITYLLDYLINQKIDEVILSVGYLRDQIINYFGTEYRTLSIEYAIEKEPLGTGGAIKFALENCNEETVFVLNGDTYFAANLDSMELLHLQSNADATIAIKRVENASRYGLVETDAAGRITDFREKDLTANEGLINSGIYLINKQALDNVNAKRFSLENDFFKVSCSLIKLQAFVSNEFFLDMGIPDDYKKAQTLIPSQGND